MARDTNGGVEAPHRAWDPSGTVVVEREGAGRDNVGDVVRRRII